MSSDQENPIPEQNSQPTASQDPTPEASIPPSTSEQVEVPPVAPEAPTQAESAIPVNNPSDAEAMAGKDIDQIEPVEAVPEQTPKDSEAAYGAGGQDVISPPPTAQIPANEPFANRQELLMKARASIQDRKRKKLEKILEVLNTKEKITNDEVEKLLHISDATATRYLEQLEKEGKIKQEGRTGKSVSYSRM